MRQQKTEKVILRLNKKKDTQTHSIVWKDFNVKRMVRLLPKVKTWITEINAVVEKIVTYKQMQFLKLTMLLINKEKMSAWAQLTNSSCNNELKYSSFLTTQIKKHECILNEPKFSTTEEALLNVYNTLVYLNAIKKSIKENTKVSTLVFPKKTTVYTVLRSPHADKKTREQFAKQISSAKIIMNQHICLMKHMRKQINSHTKAYMSSYKYTTIY